MRQVHTSLCHIVRALQRPPPHHMVDDADRTEDFYVRVGTMDIRLLLERFPSAKHIPAAQSIIIVGDRRDVQEKAIEIGFARNHRHRVD